MKLQLQLQLNRRNKMTLTCPLHLKLQLQRDRCFHLSIFINKSAVITNSFIALFFCWCSQAQVFHTVRVSYDSVASLYGDPIHALPIIEPTCQDIT